MSNKTKEEIEQLAELTYPIKKDLYRELWSENNAFIKGYAQCQEILTARILELEKQLVVSELNAKDITETKDIIIHEKQQQIESLTNLAVMEVSCKEDTKIPTILELYNGCKIGNDLNICDKYDILNGCTKCINFDNH